MAAAVVLFTALLIISNLQLSLCSRGDRHAAGIKVEPVAVTKAEPLAAASATTSPPEQAQKLSDTLSPRNGTQEAGGRQPSTFKEHLSRRRCSRERSRVAREIVEKYLMHMVELHNYKLPPKCKVDPNDMYRTQDGMKEKYHDSEWRCVYCNKLFRSEAFMDKHFDNRHLDKLEPGNTHCLADACPILHCDHYLALQGGGRGRGRGGIWGGAKRGGGGDGGGPCTPEKAAAKERWCAAAAAHCFPPEGGDVARILNQFFRQQFCDAHTCDASWQRRVFAKGPRVDIVVAARRRVAEAEMDLVEAQNALAPGAPQGYLGPYFQAVEEAQSVLDAAKSHLKKRAVGRGLLHGTRGPAGAPLPILHTAVLVQAKERSKRV